MVKRQAWPRICNRDYREQIQLAVRAGLELVRITSPALKPVGHAACLSDCWIYVNDLFQFCAFAVHTVPDISLHVGTKSLTSKTYNVVTRFYLFK